MVVMPIWYVLVMLVIVAAAGVAVGIWIRSEQAAVPVWSEEGGEE